MTEQMWILIGGDTLLGKEVRDLLSERRFPLKLALCSAGAEESVLTEEEGELSVMKPLKAIDLEEAAVILLAGTAQSSQAALAMARKLPHRPVFVDLRGDLEDLPESRMRAPALEAAEPDYAADIIHTIVHPAASALARLLITLNTHRPIRRAVVTIFEPVSARGKAGVEELHRQTVSLFSFQAMPKEVFDAQASFNLLPRYGEDAPQSLSAVEHRIERHLASLLGPRDLPLPSIRLVHAPVFHGYCQSVWVEFAERPAAQEVEKWLESEGVDVRRANLEPASNTTVAGQSGITVSDIAPDRGDPFALWLWLASDNLRTTAESAVLAAGLATRQGAR